jgi:TetR/AcrR family transcriptional repressor of nem operon
VPRTKEFQPAEALDRAMEVFWRQGYAATPVDQLVRCTGASRYGLYATFGGKRDLFLAALERYSQAVMDPVLEPLEDARASATEIRAFFDRVIDVVRRPGDGRGCLICNTAFERGARDPSAARRVRRHFDRVRRLLARALTNARRDGSLARELAVPACADHLLGTAAGAFLLARSGMAIGFIRRFVDTTLQRLA